VEKSELMDGSEVRAAMWRYRCKVVLERLYEVLSCPDCKTVLNQETRELFDSWEHKIRAEERKR